MTRSERLERFRTIDLYPVITEAFCAGRMSLQVLREVLKGGVRIVQLREKDKPRPELLELARAFRQLTRAVNALLIVNDDVELALAVEADGVHLGQHDQPVPEARRRGPELLIGVSTHSRDEAERGVEEGADYINVGPIFATATKAVGYEPLGPGQIPRITAGLALPFTVMGGIKLDNLDEVLRQGARRVAMVTEITQATDVLAQVQRLRARIHSKEGL